MHDKRKNDSKVQMDRSPLTTGQLNLVRTIKYKPEFENWI